MLVLQLITILVGEARTSERVSCLKWSCEGDECSAIKPVGGAVDAINPVVDRGVVVYVTGVELSRSWIVVGVCAMTVVDVLLLAACKTLPTADTMLSTAADDPADLS